MSQKQYWKGLEEQQGTEAHKVAASNEFSEPLPFDMSEGLLEAQTPRRDFLKYLGFSTAAAMLAASCEMPMMTSKLCWWPPKMATENAPS